MRLEMASSGGEFQNPSEPQHPHALYKVDILYVIFWCLHMGHAEPLSYTLLLGNFQYPLITSHFFGWVQHDTQSTGNFNFFLGTFYNFPGCFQSLVVWIWGWGIWGRVLGSELLIVTQTAPHPQNILRLFSVFRKQVSLTFKDQIYLIKVKKKIRHVMGYQHRAAAWPWDGTDPSLLVSIWS